MSDEKLNYVQVGPQPTTQGSVTTLISYSEEPLSIRTVHNEDGTITVEYTYPGLQSVTASGPPDWLKVDNADPWKLPDDVETLEGDWSTFEPYTVDPLTAPVDLRLQIQIDELSRRLDELEGRNSSETLSTLSTGTLAASTLESTEEREIETLVKELTLLASNVTNLANLHPIEREILDTLLKEHRHMKCTSCRGWVQMFIKRLKGKDST